MRSGEQSLTPCMWFYTVYIHRVAVINGDGSYSDNVKNLSSSMNSFVYQPLIPQTNLNITLTTVFVRELSVGLTISVGTGGDGMHLCFVDFMNIII